MGWDRYRDLTGMRFGRLLVMKRTGHIRSGNAVRSVWLCQCDCGKMHEVDTKSLTSGNTRSCGCTHFNPNKKKHLPRIGNRIRDLGDPEKCLRLRNIWANMKARCYNQNSPEFHRYGGRGITVCEEWKNSSREFVKWGLKHGYKLGLSIDRIDNDGMYCPENCQFITVGENAAKTSKEKLITVGGRTQNLTQWASELNCSRTHMGEKYRDCGETAVIMFITKKLGGQRIGVE